MPIKNIKKIEKINGESVIDLRKRKINEPKFKVNRIDDEDNEDPINGDVEDQENDLDLGRIEKKLKEVNPEILDKVYEDLDGQVASQSEPQQLSAEPKDTIKVNFGKFVNLVTVRDISALIENNAEQTIILSTDLLSELAAIPEEKSEKKNPLIFFVGLMIGILLTYLLFNH